MECILLYPLECILLHTSVLIGDCHTVPLSNNSIDCIITSPSYWGLKGYGVEGQIGSEPTLQSYINNLLQCFEELYRVLQPHGTLWLISGDLHPDVCGVPWMLIFCLQAKGWHLRHDLIWAKPTRAHDYVFLLTKASPSYFYAPQQDNSIWNFEPEDPYPGAIFEPLPTKLIENCIRWGCRPEGTIFNPFSGSGTVGVVAQRLGYNVILMDLDPAAARLANERLR